jgi:hypothetical protein
MEYGKFERAGAADHQALQQGGSFPDRAVATLSHRRDLGPSQVRSEESTMRRRAGEGERSLCCDIGNGRYSDRQSLIGSGSAFSARTF